MPDGSYEVYRRGDRVVLVMRGHYTAANAKASADEIMGHFMLIGEGEFVVDLSEATGFDRESRQHWQGRLKELASHVHTVALVNGTPLLRMAGSAVCLYAGVKLRNVSSLEEALAPRPQRAS